MRLTHTYRSRMHTIDGEVVAAARHPQKKAKEELS